MNESIGTLNIDYNYKQALVNLLQQFNIETMYCNMLKNLTANSSGIICLSSYTKSDFLNKERLMELKRDLQIINTGYDMILLELKELVNTHSLDGLVNKFPMISVEILELIMINPDYIANLIAQQESEYNTFNLLNQKYITEYTIYVATNILTPNTLETFNPVDMYNKYIHMFQNLGDKYIGYAIAKRVCQLQRTLHQLRGTKLCIIDTETTDLKYRLPVQISYILTDINLNVLETYDKYILQSFIHPGAANVHGITIEELNNELNAVQPTEALKDIDGLINDYKIIFVAHNANFDISVLKALYKQCNATLGELNSLCTLNNAKMFCKYTPNMKLRTLIHSLDISESVITSTLAKLYENSDSTVSYHRATYDTSALYMILREGDFFNM